MDNIEVVVPSSLVVRILAVVGILVLGRTAVAASVETEPVEIVAFEVEAAS